MNTSRHAAGYVRVSSEEQAQHGISVDAQRAILEGWAAMTQAGPIEIYEDAGFSGKNTQRPALQRLLADVRAGGISAVVVWKLDRLSRSLRDTLSIIEDVLQPLGVTLVSTTESIDTATPAGRMMLNMLASFAQLEREQDSDRVLMAHKHLAEDCRYLGGHIPLGYQVDASRHYQLDPVTAPMVRQVFAMYLAQEGYSAILEFLNRETGPFFQRKTLWKKTDLNYLLSNEIYAGVYIRKLGKERIRVPGGVPAILTPEEWARVCRLREENRTRSAAYRPGVYPLSGLVRCGVCGQIMTVNYGGKDRDGTPARYYVCKQNHVKPARLEPLEQLVEDTADTLAGQAEAIRAACRIANDYAAGDDRDRLAASAAVERELLRVQKRIAQIVAFISESGASAPATLSDELRRLEADKAAVTDRLERMRRPSARYDAEATVAALAACADIKKAPRSTRRALLREAFAAIYITAEDVSAVMLWHMGGGDDPPAYICHTTPRTQRGGRTRAGTLRVTQISDRHA